jgi:hypothetical protein
MNHTQEEHRIRLFSPTSVSYRDSFTALWTAFARQHHFLKLTLPSPLVPSSSTSSLDGSDTSPHDPIKQAIHQRDGSISPYSTTLFEPYQIIYQKDQTVIVTNKTTHLIGNFFAVEDTDCPNRYFIAFAFSAGGMTESITGLIVYFNEKGYCDSDRTTICQRVLTTYDIRNGLIREKQMYFYHQSLFFTQIQRDTRKLILYLHYVPYHSEAIEDDTTYITNEIVPYSSQVWGESITLFKRFLRIPLADTPLLIDLGSFDCVEEKTEDMTTVQRYFIFYTYRLERKEDTMKFLEIASLFPERVYSDGYPLHCIQCYHATVAASYTYKCAPYSSTHTGLGNSYCTNCRIRYSDSKKRWLCAEIRIDGTICHHDLLESGCCSSASHSSDQTILLLYDTPFPKYPYRQHVRIQWTPSEDAKRCAQTSRLFSATDTPLSCDP